MNGRWLIFFAAAALQASSVFAGTIQIAGQPKLTFGIGGGRIAVRGEYTIENRGNEAALAAFPELRLGRWGWAGEPRTLEPNKPETWSVVEEFDAVLLECESADAQAPDLCAGRGLPVVGRIPVFITLHYKDLNSRSFSAPDVLPVILGELTKEQHHQLQTAQIQTNFVLKGAGQEFSGSVKVYNSARSEREVSVGWFTSRELRITTSPQVLMVASGASAQTAMQAENFSGLVGSRYPVFVVLQWREGDVRAVQLHRQFATLEKVEKLNYFLTALAAVGLISLIAIYLLVFRNSSGPDSK